MGSPGLGSVLRLPACGLAALLLLSGCPLVSDFPLSDPASAEIDEELLGDWMVPDDSGGARSFSFLPFAGGELVGFARGDEAGSVEAFRAFTTSVGEERFLNVRELGSRSAGWYFLRYRIEGRRLSLSLVDDALFKDAALSRSDELLDRLRGSLDDPRLYGSGAEGTSADMVWERPRD